MPEESEEIVEEWKQLSVDFEDSLEIDFLDEEDALEVVHDGEL
jgi:hypothetical protein